MHKFNFKYQKQLLSKTEQKEYCSILMNNKEILSKPPLYNKKFVSDFSGTTNILNVFFWSQRVPIKK